MRTTNYPNHPLFRIAPLLDRGFQTVLHDEYTSRLIGRIRAGRYTPELWDCNSFYLGYSERLAAPADRQTTALKSRYSMTPQEWEAYRNDPARQEERAQLAAERAAKKARREAKEAEFARLRREYAERQARLAAEKERIEAERAAEWDRVGAETQQYLTERAMIMAGSWECTQCLTPSEVSSQPAGRYAISCRRCGRRAFGDHVALLEVMNARNAQPEPEIVGSRL